MNLNEVMLWLVEKKYVQFHKDKPIFTDQARKEMKTSSAKPLQLANLDSLQTLQSKESTQIMVQGVKYTEAEWEGFYRKFLLACKIPARCEGKDGQSYELNKYSVEGVKAFKKAIQAGYQLDILIVTVSLYYQNSVRLKKAVGNYMASEEWKTDYETLLQKAEEGKVDEHIKQEMKNGTATQYSWFEP